MTADFVVLKLQEMLTLGTVLAAPLLGAAMAVGIVVAVFQAATQIQESTLSFVPKLLAVAGVLVVIAPWALDKLVTLTHGVFADIASTVSGIH